jgi:predicted  nucleic acid-binding Zn-ribbon protein
VKADDLKPLVDILTERLNNTNKLLETSNKALDELRAEYKKLQQEHNDHRRETEKENAILKREVEELKKSKDLWGNRAFTLLMCLVSGVLGGIVTYLVKKP